MIFSRQKKYNSFISRDYKTISCKAVNCKYNISEECAVPSLCKINENGSCKNFTLKEDKHEGDGD